MDRTKAELALGRDREHRVQEWNRCDPHLRQSFNYSSELAEQHKVPLTGQLQIGSEGIAQFAGEHIGDNTIECLPDETGQPLLHGLPRKKCPVDAIDQHPSDRNTVFLRGEVPGAGQKEANLSRHSFPTIDVNRVSSWAFQRAELLPTRISGAPHLKGQCAFEDAVSLGSIFPSNCDGSPTGSDGYVSNSSAPPRSGTAGKIYARAIGRTTSPRLPGEG
jgi:hypothetical protein